MRNFSILLTVLFIVIRLNAQQHVDLKQVIPVQTNGLLGHSSPNGTCDSLNLFQANSWEAFYYKYRGGGSVLGTNNLTATREATILENANYFDVTGSDYKFITGGLVYFAFANSNVPANLNKDIIFKVYDDAGGLPGTILGSASLTLSQVHQDVLNRSLTEFKFSSAVALPSPKNFYISVDNSNFSWSFDNKDSIAIVATENHATPGDAFQYVNINGAQWYPVKEFWRNNKKDSLDVTLFIFPYVSAAKNSCAVLPVNIFNFNGFIKDNQAHLNWSTAMESNNKGFYIERSTDNKNFANIGFIKGAVNSSQVINYSYTDATLKDVNAATVYYRLKQVDLDGNYSYYKVLPLNLQNIVQFRIYPNPVKDIATVEINMQAAAKLNIQVISRDGKILINSDKGILNQGIQTVYINMKNLPQGSYIVKVTAGDKIYFMPLAK